MFTADSTGNGVRSLERPCSSTRKRHRFVKDVVVRVRLSVLSIEQRIERMVVSIRIRIVMCEENASVDEYTQYSTSSISSSVVVTPDDTIPS